MTNSITPALIIIDMINDFQFKEGALLAEKAEHLTKPINALRAYFHHHNHPVIYVNDHYNLWQANLYKIIDYCSNDISDKVIQKIQPRDDEYFLIKPKHSGFFGTALNTLLNQLNIDTLYLAGIAGNICVLFTANDAYMREYQLVVPENCIASNCDEDNQYALLMMNQVLKANIDPISEDNYNITGKFPS
ncbi:MAG: isochorismatase family cysteine hydrolase [Cytobacillus gottheilii]|uniref:cysteine hydrolase family protein n=1 Tax=Cytobacillus gottheilii TaxID=859144 RepID=UPI003464625B